MPSKGEVVHEVEDGYVISGDGIWLPGKYESREAAEYAFEFCVDLQARLRDAAIDNDGIVTLDAMRALQAEAGYSCGQGAHRVGWRPGEPLVFDEDRRGP